MGTSQPMGFALQLVVEGFAALGLSFSYGWKLTLVILASIPLSAVILHFISRGLQAHIASQGEALSEASQTANNAISNIQSSSVSVHRARKVGLTLVMFAELLPFF